MIHFPSKLLISFGSLLVVVPSCVVNLCVKLNSYICGNNLHVSYPPACVAAENKQNVDGVSVVSESETKTDNTFGLIVC
jgi:hypothetical protein